MVIVANLEAHAFRLVGGNESDGFTVIQAFAFLAGITTFILGRGKHLAFKEAAWGFGLGVLGLSQGSDLLQKFFAGSAPFKDQAVQFFLWVQIFSGALVLATALALLYVGVRSLWLWVTRKFHRA
ncbi:hypothetical protein ACI3L1_03620 [Deinococcus sp. SM5_A1]|uniref:hypothetical protein n=1 Tax=Deinococcus sp. SM5_A1 TaxID=3379094 RepID=UPI00385ABCAA